MAMFGKGAPLDPSALSGADRLALFGATLRDVGGALRGDDSQALMQAQAMLGQRQNYAQQQAMAKRAAGLFGGQAAAMPAPVVNQGGEDISAAFGAQGAPQAAPKRFDPRMAAGELAQLAAQGFDITPYTKLAEIAKPNLQAVNGKVLDYGDPNTAGMEVPEVDKGQIRLYTPDGKFYGVANAQGAVQSAADMAGAVEGAKARATAPYEFQAVPGVDGRSVVGAKSALAGQVFAGQSPTEAAQAASQTQAAIDLPKDLGGAQQTLDLIQKLRTHPGRQWGTGMTGVVPAVPGSATKDFVTLLDQAKGTGFLTAIGSLKGTGQITEIEGKKATDAIARMDRTQSEAGFLSALKDYEDVVRAGMDRAQRKAGAGSFGRGGVGAAPPPRSAVEAELRRRGLIR